MYNDHKILVGKSEDKDVFLFPKMANRHGLIAGATGTGKTVTLKVMAESFSDCGVPVFLADAKGDLAGMCKAGETSESVQKRVDAMNLGDKGFAFKAYPVNYFDVYGENGMPLRTTISEMGPMLLARIMGLTEVQTGVLTLVFKIADDEGLLLIDTKDLRSMLQYVAENAKTYSERYGNITKQSLGVITRSVIAMEEEGADLFFGEPALNIKDWLATDCDGHGMIQILDCQKLMLHPVMYSTFLLYMMSELYETLPEAGDMEKPRMVFFFDEAHMLFDGASKVLLEKIAQVVKLIRSKGVGIYFITQNPKDIPDDVLAQLGNKVQHALRAYTPADQKKVKAAAQSYRANPDFDTFEAMQNLAIGEALVSVLDEQGIPTIVEKTTILPPQSRMGTITDEERKQAVESSLLYVKYKDSEDRDSAYEFLQRRQADINAAQEKEKADKEQAKQDALTAKQKEKEEAAEKKAKEKQKKQIKSAVGSVAGTAASTVGREIGNTVGKSIGGSFGKKLGGNVGSSLGRGILRTLFSK